MKKLAVFLGILILPNFTFAHDVVKDLENISKAEIAITYLKIGFQHILPLGFDHILFIVSLVLFSLGGQSLDFQNSNTSPKYFSPHFAKPNMATKFAFFFKNTLIKGSKLKQLYWQSAAFTVGHCITLALASIGIFKISPSFVEPIIAITIIYVAAENIFLKKIKPSRIVLIFAFGLLHGLGFASALADIGLPKSAFLTSLFLFNLGLELGQITVIIFSFLVLTYIQKWRNIAWAKIVSPISILIICISSYWVYERIFI